MRRVAMVMVVLPVEGTGVSEGAGGGLSGGAIGL